MKYPHEHGEISVCDCRSVLGVHRTWKLCHAHPNSSWLSNQHCGNRVREHLYRFVGSFVGGWDNQADVNDWHLRSLTFAVTGTQRRTKV